MFIETEPTPNPNSMKFLPGRPVLPEGSRNFLRPEDAAISPLARSLFTIEGVEGVFLGPDFITVSKVAEQDWQMMRPFLLAAIMDHFLANHPVLQEGSAAQIDASPEGEPEIVVKIKEILDSRVRPAVAQDGGDIVFRGYEAGIVYLHMQGACAGCPSSTATLKMGIENMLRYYLPEVTEVRPV